MKYYFKLQSPSLVLGLNFIEYCFFTIFFLLVICILLHLYCSRMMSYILPVLFLPNFYLPGNFAEFIFAEKIANCRKMPLQSAGSHLHGRRERIWTSHMEGGSRVGGKCKELWEGGGLSGLN